MPIRNLVPVPGLRTFRKDLVDSQERISYLAISMCNTYEYGYSLNFNGELTIIDRFAEEWLSLMPSIGMNWEF